MYARSAGPGRLCSVAGHPIESPSCASVSLAARDAATSFSLRPTSHSWIASPVYGRTSKRLELFTNDSVGTINDIKAPSESGSYLVVSQAVWSANGTGCWLRTCTTLEVFQCTFYAAYYPRFRQQPLMSALITNRITYLCRTENETSKARLAHIQMSSGACAKTDTHV